MKISACLLILLSFWGCDQEPKFVTTSSGLKYRFINQSDTGVTGNVKDFYLVNLTLSTLEDEILMEEFTHFERFNSIYPGDVHEGLSLLRVGDSAEFILDADSFFIHHGMQDRRPKAIQDSGISVKLKVGVKDIQTPFEHFVQISERELSKMKEFVNRKGWNSTLDTTGIMYEIVQPNPTGKMIEPGDSAEISYLYYTLAEKIIQKSKEGDFWKIKVYDPKLRVSGLGRLLTLAKEGEKIRGVLPFSEAFGENGLGVMIPPYTTIVMELEIHNVIKK